MASDDTYRDYYFMSRRRTLLDKLNKIDAPPMSTIFNIVKTKGTEDKRQAELLVKTAIDSKDLQVMGDALVELENIRGKAPKLYQDYIGQLSETMKVNMNSARMNQDVADTTDRIRSEFEKLSPHERTAGAPDFVKQTRDSYFNIGEGTSRRTLLKAGDLMQDVSSAEAAMKILARFDADPSTPEIDIPEGDDVPYIQKQFSSRAKEIDEAYMGTGNYLEALKRADELSRTSLRTDIAIDAVTQSADRRIKQGIIDAEETRIDDLEDANIDSYNAYEQIFLDEIRYNVEVNKMGNDEAIATALKKVENSEPFRTGRLNFEEFSVYLHNLDPYTQDITGIDTKTPPLSAKIEAANAQAKLFQSQQNEARSGVLSEVESGWKEAFKALDIDPLSSSPAYQTMSRVESFMFSGSEKDRKSADMGAVIKSIDRSISKILEDNDPWGSFWGIEKPTDLFIGFDVEDSPLKNSRRKAMDSIIATNYKIRNKLDPEYRTAFINLKKARDAAYRGIDLGLFNMAMDKIDVYTPPKVGSGK